MPVSKSMRYQVLRRDGYKCHYCGASAPDATLHVDHVIPEALGGASDPSNLLTACSDCNLGKSATPPDAQIVEAVDSRNVAWAAALEQARTQAREDDDKRRRIITWFLKEWDEYAICGEPFPLPDNYEKAVVTWAERGLTKRDMRGLIAVTMSREGLWRNERFRYFAGCCWRQITQLDQAAERIMREQDESEK